MTPSILTHWRPSASGLTVLGGEATTSYPNGRTVATTCKVAVPCRTDREAIVAKVVADAQARDDVRALLIEMRQYVVFHGLLIGECVAWAKLKDMHGLGVDWAVEDAWLKEYRGAKAKEGD